MIEIPVAHAAERAWTKKRIIQVATTESDVRGLNTNHFIATLIDESVGLGDITIQSSYIKKDGTREKSFGLCQINLDAHPDITYEQATNPAFCIPWMADRWEEGHADMWSSWTKLKAKYGDGDWPI